MPSAQSSLARDAPGPVTLPQKLRLGDTVVLRAEPQYYNTHAAYDWRTSRTEFLTDREYQALQYVYDKAADGREVAAVAQMQYGACRRFLQRMAQGGYVTAAEETVSPPPARSSVDLALFDPFPIPFLSAPTSVDVFVTSRCNLRCVHCFASREDVGTRDLSLHELESLFNQLERMGVMEVRLTGGEPLLHPAIQSLLAFLRRKRFRKVLITNGTTLDEATVRRLQEAEVIPTVSLEDVQAEAHDGFSGVAGSFHRTLAALHQLQAEGVPYGINCCLHRGNLDRWEALIKLAIQWGAARVAFLDLKEVGRMKQHPEWVPTWSAYQSLLDALRLAKARYKKRIDVSLDAFLHCYPLRESIYERKRGYVSCKAGINRLTIDSDATVYPCNLVLSDPHWAMGNLRTETMAAIWFSKKWLFFRGGVKIRDLPTCRSCSSLPSCSDVYCRLLPYVDAGDVFAPHPACR
jgi:radical SAM protein with 4Fe4S-binding SPASM domain